jgi:hypothetical protein
MWENVSNNLNFLCCCCCIINIYYTKNVTKKAEYFINLSLKSNKGVKKAKRYYKGFKKAITGVKYRYLFLAFFIRIWLNT